MQQAPPKKTCYGLYRRRRPAVRDAIRWLMERVNSRSRSFSSADEFLANYTPGTRGCIILDIRMPGMSGLELQERLKAAGNLLPIIIITGHGDVSIAVRAMKAGELNFCKSPSTTKCCSIPSSRRFRLTGVWDQEERRQQYNRSLSSLTKREKEVLNLLRTGKANKVIASILNISVRTVEGHRATIMSKTGAKSLGELIEMLHANT